MFVWYILEVCMRTGNDASNQLRAHPTIICMRTSRMYQDYKRYYAGVKALKLSAMERLREGGREGYTHW